MYPGAIVSECTFPAGLSAAEAVELVHHKDLAWGNGMTLSAESLDGVSGLASAGHSCFYSTTITFTQANR